MGKLLPVTVVASVLAWTYGRSVRHAWLPSAITFVLVLLGGLLFSGIGQIAGVALSALVIFVAFTLPEHRRVAQEEAAREKDASQLPNEEDL